MNKEIVKLLDKLNEVRHYCVLKNEFEITSNEIPRPIGKITLYYDIDDTEVAKEYASELVTRLCLDNGESHEIPFFKREGTKNKAVRKEVWNWYEGVN